MKTYVLYYDGFAEFEVIIAIGNLASKGDIVPVAIENRPYVSEEKQTFLPAVTISEVNPGDVDVFLIPGGDTGSIIDNKDLGELLLRLYKQDKIIGAICGGVLLLGHHGILEGKSFTCFARGYEIDDATREKYFPNARYQGHDVVVDGKIITAMGQAFVEFGTEVADAAGVYGSAEERENDYRWIKNLTPSLRVADSILPEVETI
jgi:putative intracellular protease/amidase